MDEQQRKKAHAALENHFKRTGWPGWILSLIVILTGSAGFLVSHMLLSFGEVKMWIRYPIAVALAYTVFLGLLRVWAELERRRIDPESAQSMIKEDSPAPTKKPGSHGALGLLDLIDPGFFDAHAACGIVCAVIFVIAAVISLVAFVISTAPGLIADVFIDAVLMTALYNRLKTAARQHWLATAIRRTWIAALFTAVALSLIGFMIQQQSPKARSIGDLWRQQ